jgi:hypothetical protein
MNKESVSMRTDKNTAAANPKPPPDGKPKPNLQSSPAVAPNTTTRNRYSRGERLRKLETWVPRLAVAVVAASALAAVVYTGGYDPRELLAFEWADVTKPAEQEAQTAPAEQTPQVAQAVTSASMPEAATGAATNAEKQPVLSVVTAPPLKAPAKVAVADSAVGNAAARSPDTGAMGSNAVCAKCGVVETVVAVHGYAQPQASGYQMHIRMDDGTVRTVEQRGALAAGSRVIVERGAVKALADPAGQG